MPKQTTRSATPIGAYTYQIDPPQPARLLRSVRALLDLERTDARAAGRIWEGRVVREQVVTHILVVADSPAQDRAVNDKVVAALNELGAVVSMTAALSAADDPPTAPPPV